jgi:hypothetical protein
VRRLGSVREAVEPPTNSPPQSGPKAQRRLLVRPSSRTRMAGESAAPGFPAGETLDPLYPSSGVFVRFTEAR